MTSRLKYHHTTFYQQTKIAHMYQNNHDVLSNTLRATFSMAPKKLFMPRFLQFGNRFVMLSTIPTS